MLEILEDTTLDMVFEGEEEDEEERDQHQQQQQLEPECTDELMVEMLQQQEQDEEAVVDTVEAPGEMDKRSPVVDEEEVDVEGRRVSEESSIGISVHAIPLFN